MSQAPIAGRVTSSSELFRVVRRLREQHPDSLFLFRGQTDLHEELKAGQRRSARVVREVEKGWIQLATQMIGAKANDPVSLAFAKAILQHYGFATEFVDLTSDPDIAAWFAKHQWQRLRYIWGGEDSRQLNRVQYRALDDGIGYVLVLSIPNSDELLQQGQLLNLNQLPREVLRPHRQIGWLLRDDGSASSLPHRLWIATIEIDRAKFGVSHQQSELFPAPSADLAYRDLLRLPFVQIPWAYLRGDENEKPRSEDAKEMALNFCFGERLLSIPEYFENNDGYDHKWDDVTLFEPKPVRLWRGWNFELSSRSPELTGNIANAAKITIGYRAKELLERSTEGCRWPDIESDDVFFSFAEMGHDKVIDHGPNYFGIWLHRVGKMLFETTMIADDEKLSVAPGLSYELNTGKLIRTAWHADCPCGDTEKHLNPVAAVLRIPELVAKGELLFLPHPIVPGWYVTDAI